MSDIPREFDAMFRSENAQLYGMCISTFRRLAEACIAAHRYGDIVAHTIERFPKGRKGCCVLLAGKNFGFRLHVDDTITYAAFVALWAQRLDTHDEPFSLFADDPCGNADEWAFNQLVNIMIRLDGLRANWRQLTFDQAHELIYREGFFES